MSGYVGEKLFQEFGPRFVAVSSARMVQFAAKKRKRSQISCVNEKGCGGERVLDLYTDALSTCI